MFLNVRKSYSVWDWNHLPVFKIHISPSDSIKCVPLVFHFYHLLFPFFVKVLWSVSLHLSLILLCLILINKSSISTKKQIYGKIPKASSQTSKTINCSSKVFMKAQILMCVYMPLQHVFLHYSNNYMFKLQHKCFNLFK